MPPKAKKTRASLKLDESGQIRDEAAVEVIVEAPAEPSVRQVVEVVEEEGNVPEAIETIKKDAEEIEEAVEHIEDEVSEAKSHAPREQEDDDTKEPPMMNEDLPKDEKANVESLFVNSEPGVTPEITVVGKRGPSLGVWVGAMLGVALAIGVSLILLVRGPSSLSFVSPKPTPTPEPTEAPKPTEVPVANVKKNDVKVSVVNGGGTPGAGSKMKKFLEDKGYTVVSVGNADDYTFTATVVIAKSDKASYARLVSEDLKADYSLGTSTNTVPDSAAFDVQVIVGKEE